ncbi:MAG TPA: class I SAM-dependent methyltransferase [Bryobacteraceae bacterium]|nr:class I SAM-dependent methyltransferase [Bryobacteraceae bacterium]
MQPSFLQRYLQAFHSIKGWFQFDAALLFMAYNQLRRAEGPDRDVLEIGVYHGLSTIAMAALRGAGNRLVAIDPFENSPADNIAMYGGGIRAKFERNFSGFYPDAAFLNVIGKSSRDVTAASLGGNFTFCHIDGGHSREETCHDLELCCEILVDGGLLAMDDYFNPQHPGVCEGGVEFFLRDCGRLQPLAVAYNKVLFQKCGKAAEKLGLNERFLAAFPRFEHEMVTMWGAPVILAAAPLRDSIDLYASTPECFVPFGSAGPRAIFRPSTPVLRAQLGADVTLEVEIENVSSEKTPAGRNVFGLSYHLLTGAGSVLQHDNARTWIIKPIQPGERRVEHLKLKAPATPGHYTLEVDLVWESVMWFGDAGNPTARVSLTVA